MPASPTVIEKIRDLYRRFQNTVHKIQKDEEQDYVKAFQDLDQRKIDQVHNRINQL